MAPLPSWPDLDVRRLGALLSDDLRAHLQQYGAIPPLIQPRGTPSQWPSTITATSTLPALVRRQTIVAIPNTYSDLNSGPAPGTVIGIVFGSVAGFLLLLWLIYTCFNRGNGSGAMVTEEDVIVRSSRRGSRSSRRAETVEVSRSRSRSPVPRSPVRTESRTERVIVEERRMPVDREDDIVEVIEDHSPPPRRSKSGRGRPASGYRSVEPDRFAGGNRPVEEVYVKRSSRRGPR